MNGHEMNFQRNEDLYRLQRGAWTSQVPSWQLGLVLCLSCVPCCALAGLCAILTAVLDVELTPKAFACDVLPEDAKDTV